MKMLVLGDSTSFGAELSDLPSKQFGWYGNDYVDKNNQLRFSPPSNLAWPALLAARLNVQVDNQSIIGGSNDRIFRLAIEHTLTQHWDLVICAWTSVDRFDLTDGARDLAISANAYWKFSWVKEYIASHWDYVRNDVNFLTKLIALQSYFAQKNQPYLFVKSTDIKLCEEVQAVHQQLDKTHCVDWDNDFYTWTIGDPTGPNGHILEQGHVRIADAMYSRVQQIIK